MGRQNLQPLQFPDELVPETLDLVLSRARIVEQEYLKELNSSLVKAGVALAALVAIIGSLVASAATLYSHPGVGIPFFVFEAFSIVGVVVALFIANRPLDSLVPPDLRDGNRLMQALGQDPITAKKSLLLSIRNSTANNEDLLRHRNHWVMVAYSCLFALITIVLIHGAVGAQVQAVLQDQAKEAPPHAGTKHGLESTGPRQLTQPEQPADGLGRIQGPERRSGLSRQQGIRPQPQGVGGNSTGSVAR